MTFTVIAALGLLSILAAPSIQLPWREGGDSWAVAWFIVVGLAPWLPNSVLWTSRQRIIGLLSLIGVPALLVVAAQDIIASQGIGLSTGAAFLIVVTAVFSRRPLAPPEVAERPAVWWAFLFYLFIAGVVLATVGLVEVGRFESWRSQQPRKVTLDGQPRGQVVISRFLDYRCSQCASTFNRYDPIFRQLIQQIPDRVRLMHYDVPQDPECNDGRLKAPMPLGCIAAVFAAVADRVSKRPDAEAFLFAERRTLTQASVQTAAETLGLVTLLQQYSDEEIARIRRDIEFATTLTITSVPSYFVNGIEVGFWEPFDVARLVHEEASRNNWMRHLLIKAWQRD